MRGLATAAAVSVGLLVSGTSGVRAEAPRDNEKIWPYLASLPVEQRKAVIEEEAKRDGSIVVYGVTGLDRLQFFAKAFNAIHPEIKVDVVRLTEAEAAQRLVAERKAGRSQADVVLFAPTSVVALKFLVSPYESTEWPKYDKRFLYGGAGQGWAAAAFETFPTSIAWRTDRVPASEAPKTLDDLNDPKWKGRVGAVFSLEALVGGFIEKYGEADAIKRLERLASLNNRLYSSHAALADALSAGEIDLAWNLTTNRPTELKAKGSPIDWRYMDPLFAENKVAIIPNDTKKPYAAALFVDTLLSAKLLEASDAWDPSRIFGNTEGSYRNSLDKLPPLTIYPTGDAAELKKWSAIKEKLFVRRQ